MSIYSFGTKAETLRYLFSNCEKLGGAKVLKPVYFTVLEWTKNPVQVLDYLAREFSGLDRLIVRSNDSIIDLCTKEYVYNESIYPLQTYKAKIVDEHYIYLFETEGLCGEEDCMIDASRYNSVLLDKRNNLIVNDRILKNRYEGIVLDHIGIND